MGDSDQGTRVGLVFLAIRGAVVLHPLEDTDGTRFYADAEDVLAKLPRRGIPMIMHEPRGKPDADKPKQARLYSASGMAKLVRRIRDAAKLPATFTLDACRHGGMTELEEAELTDGQGRALSAHKSRAYEGYAKRTMERALAATRKRHAHRLAIDPNASGTEFRNEGSGRFRNAQEEQTERRNSPVSSHRLCGWGGRIRTSAWRNQNPIGFTVKSTCIPKNCENSPLNASIA
jgi:hypothetical protein